MNEISFKSMSPGNSSAYNPLKEKTLSGLRRRNFLRFQRQQQVIQLIQARGKAFPEAHGYGLL